MKKKIAGLSLKGKMVLILILIILAIAICMGIIFATHNNKEKNQSSTKEIPKAIPEVKADNIKFNISNTEETEESVIITVDSKLNDYDLYYYIKPLEKIEELEQEESSESPVESQEDIEESNSNENKQEEKQIEDIVISDEDYLKYEENIEVFSNSEISFKYELNGIYSENSYSLEITNIKDNILEEALENEMATEEELAKAKVSQTDTKAKYYIVVDWGANVVTIYGKNDEGNYTVPVKAMVCSTGSATPRSGVYKLKSTRYRWRALFGNVYGQYAVPIVGNILFHSVPYTANGDPSSLEYWEYDKLGTSASMGCIRLTVADAIWIYNNCGSGTQVEFTSGASNPLGKPSAQKISNYTNLRGYDPTDPVSNNPWRSANVSNKTTTPTQTTTKPSETTTPTNNQTTIVDETTNHQENPTAEDVTPNQEEEVVPSPSPSETTDNEEEPIEDDNPQESNNEE